jgi:histidinol dehydrogenase
VKICKSSELAEDWFKRREQYKKSDELIESNVRSIINKVAEKGDAAIIEYAKKFDKVNLTAKDLKVRPREIEAAYKNVGREQIAALKLIKKKIIDFEKKVLKQVGFRISKSGIVVENVIRPIESVGCYVPGGGAVYPSTLIMNSVPAKTAGVPRIVVCSPPNVNGLLNPLILVAADICGVGEIYKVGGAQAIAALAFGTDTIKSVEKIVGPGNKYVTMAKILVSRIKAIDMPAGPSEVLVLADETANPRLIALDMISQSEHSVECISGLITPSEKLAQAVSYWLAKTLDNIERREIVAKSLEKSGFIITCKNMKEAIKLANVFAPEHVEIITRNPKRIANKITTAGLILIGSYSPVALSDYGSGTNHVLPTGGFGRVYSGLSAFDFMRRVNIVKSSKKGLQSVREILKVMTEAENLPNHYKAVEERFGK